MSASRIAKLRALGDPERNPNEHEAAAARAEADRLEKEASSAPPRRVASPVISVRFDGVADFAAWAAKIRQGIERAAADRFIEKMIAEARCSVCGVKLDAYRARFVSMTRCADHVDVLFPGDGPYNAWATARQVGDHVEVRCDGSPLIVDAARLAAVGHITIVRMTPTQYVMDDGTRYRRAGQYPGYRVGEDGSNGRHFICKVST